MKSGAFILDNTVMDLLLDTICVVDAHGRFMALTAACEQLLGYRADELIGRPMIELVLEEDRPRTAASGARDHGRRPAALL
jgi:PAS domain S-box-containing protein